MLRIARYDTEESWSTYLLGWWNYSRVLAKETLRAAEFFEARAQKSKDGGPHVLLYHAFYDRL